MQEFPGTTELQFPLGLRVSGLIFQPFSMEVIFDAGTSLVSEHSLEYEPANGEPEILDIQKGLDKTSIHKIVDHQIVCFERTPFSLSLLFDDGQKLRVISVPGPLESGHFSRGKTLLIF